MENEGKKGYWLVALVAVVIIVAGYLALKNEAGAPANNNSAGEATVCPQDVSRCPDGTYVSRVAPACEFAACVPAPTPNIEVPADWAK